MVDPTDKDTYNNTLRNKTRVQRDTFKGKGKVNQLDVGNEKDQHNSAW